MPPDRLGADVLDSMRQFEQDTQTYQTTQRVEYTLQFLGQLARYLAALPGRKNLIWFSGSFPIYIQPIFPWPWTRSG